MNRDLSTDLHSKASPHLTTEQLGEVLDASLDEMRNQDLAAARAHLEACEPCRAELESMREVVALFRESTAAYATREFISRPHAPVTAARMVPPSPHWLRPSLTWAAAGLLVAATLVPLRFHQRHPEGPASDRVVSTESAAARATKGESDAALLDDINRELSASVPESMQPLADPAAATSGADPTLPLTRKN